MAKKTEPKSATQAGMVKVRVLAAGALGQINDVIEIDAALVEALAGDVDAHPDAVAYAESLKV